MSCSACTGLDGVITKYNNNVAATTCQRLQTGHIAAYLTGHVKDLGKKAPPRLLDKHQADSTEISSAGILCGRTGRSPADFRTLHESDDR